MLADDRDADFAEEAATIELDRALAGPTIAEVELRDGGQRDPDVIGSVAEPARDPDATGETELADVASDDEPTTELPAVSHKVRARTRRTRPRSKTIALKRLTRAELDREAALYPPVDEPRPRTRSECHDAPRPCPWVACKHHLYLDINPETGSIKINFPDLEPWELAQTCALDLAEQGARTLEEIGELTNLTRERVRQVEVRGLLRLRGRAHALH